MLLSLPSARTVPVTVSNAVTVIEAVAVDAVTFEAVAVVDAVAVAVTMSLLVVIIMVMVVAVAVEWQWMWSLHWL